MAPERRFGVIILGNRSGASLPKTADKAAEIVLGLPPKPPSKPKSAVAMTEAEMHGYVGRYSNRDSMAEITLRDGKLYEKAEGRELQLAKSADGRLFAEGPEQVNIVPVPAQGPPEFLFIGFRALKRQ